MMTRIKKHINLVSIERICAAHNEGLNTRQVNERMAAGAHNSPPKSLTRSVGRIITDNLFSLFNMVNIVLAAIIMAVSSYRNLLFLGVVISNTTIGIFQGIRAKFNIDKLSIITQTKITVVRNGQEISIPQEDVVLDDVMYISLGNQICSDGEIICSQGLEVDEAQLTGEADPVHKGVGNTVLSGSYVVSGDAYVRVTAVGSANYAARLSLEAKREKNQKSELMLSLNAIIKFLSIAIIPLGLSLYGKNYLMSHDIDTAVLAATAATLGMIPEGLILLTSVAFAVSAINLTKNKVLVQSMPGIETLARIDVLCLDKTGTITDGALSVTRLLPLNGFDEGDCGSAIASIIDALPDNNATSQALKRYFSSEQKMNIALIHAVPFSSIRKWSGCSFENQGTYILGAPECILSPLEGEIKRETDCYLQEGYRLIGLAHSPECIHEHKLPQGLRLMALIVISENIREDVKDTFDYFRKQEVALKVISGDNPVSVSSIAKRAGLADADQYIDMSTIPENADYSSICKKYTIYGRVSPYQKKYLIQGFQGNGQIVAMTGDGVNDVLALKQANCSIVMATGSDAARCVSDFVLLDSNFSVMTNVVAEGRRVVNNIEKVASLFLIKTIYSVILVISFICLPLIYPFQPIQFAPVSSLTVGIPAFLLALRPNFKRIGGKFIANVLKNALPAALLVSLNISVIQIAGYFMALSFRQTSTLCIMLIGFVGFILLTRIAKPFDTKRKFMMALLLTTFASAFIFFRHFFWYANPFSIIAVIYLPLMLAGYPLFNIISRHLIILRVHIQRFRRRLKRVR